MLKIDFTKKFLQTFNDTNSEILSSSGHLNFALHLSDPIVFKFWLSVDHQQYMGHTEKYSFFYMGDRASSSADSSLDSCKHLKSPSNLAIYPILIPEVPGQSLHFGDLARLWFKLLHNLATCKVKLWISFSYFNSTSIKQRQAINSVFSKHFGHKLH